RGILADTCTSCPPFVPLRMPSMGHVQSPPTSLISEEATVSPTLAQWVKGTQHKFQHMSFRGFLRPRDLIKFCNVALEAAHHRIEGGDTNLKIINDDINVARRDYSLYLIKELDDEIAPAKKEWKRSLELLRKLGFTRWTKHALSNVIAEHGKSLNISESIDDLLQFFYSYSIVGFLRVGRGGTGAGYYEHFRYMDETIRFDLDAPSFLVHRGLREALDLQEKKEPHDE
ncbi:MAG TPA: hypothetical protein VHO06_01610, partial [Polyangia bacterium]|nr:hypothetical protein [Polyangia bacterium]